MQLGRIVRTVSWALFSTVVLSCTADSPIGPAETQPPSERLSLSVQPSTDSLVVGETHRLTAQIVNQEGQLRSAVVQWRSLDPIRASVNANGEVTAAAAGLARIVASITGAADTASVTVLAPVVAFSLYPQTVRVALGDSMRFSAQIPAGSGTAQSATVSWATSDPAVASILPDGTLLTNGEGDAVVTAKVGSLTTSASVSVFKTDVDNVTASPANSTISVGGTQEFEAIARDVDGRQLPSRGVQWSSSNPTVATVNGNGRATGISRGYAIITAEVEGKTGTAVLNVGSRPVASVIVTLPSSQLGEGQSLTATVQVLDANNQPITDQAVAWQSGNTSIATVMPNGQVSGIAAGSTTISAISGGKVGSASLEVVKRQAAALVILPSAPSVTIGAEAQLTAEVRDQSGASINAGEFTWTSSNPAVATMSQDGVLRGVSSGSVTITATGGGVSGSTTATITSVPVANLVVSPTSVSMQVGGNSTLSAVARDASGNVLTGRVVNWQSSNSAVVTVSPAGVLTAVGGGSATITVTCENKTATVSVTVGAPAPAPVANVSVTLSATTLNAGQSTQAVAVLRDAQGNTLTGRQVSWSSTNTQIATVSASGLVTAVAAGSASIVATSEQQSGAASLTVSAPAPAPVASVSIALSASTLYPGQTTQAVVTLRDAAGNVLTGRTIGYSVSHPTRASVSATGLVSALSLGDLLVTATSGGMSADAELDIVAAPSAPVASVSVTSSSNSVNAGQTLQLTGTAKDAAGQTISGAALTWSSSNTSAASVSGSGVVTGVGAGTARITAQASNGVSGFQDITVTTSTVPVASVSVSLNASALVVGLTTQATATTRDASGNVLGGRVITFSSSNTAVATVSSSGLVTATGAGTANIIAASEGKSGSAALSVASGTSTPLPPPPTGPVPTIPATLPVEYRPPAYAPPTGRVIRIGAGANLQQALDTLQRGDELRLAPGATFTGSFRLRAKAGAGWITIRSDAPDAQLPAPGQRVNPAVHASAMPKILTHGLNEDALKTEAGAARYRILGIEFGVAPTATAVNAIISLGTHLYQDATTTPSDIVLDRVYIHGPSTLSFQRCLVLNSAAAAVIDSDLSECHSKGYDSQAILGYNGPGPFLIENNRLEGAGENILFGGADPAVPNLVPSDIVIRRNYIYKPQRWLSAGWTVKNLFELKNAQRVLIEGNVLRNNWANAQSGYAVVLGSVNQAMTCSWCIVQDITFRQNHIDSTVGGFLLFEGYQGAQLMRKVNISHNLITNLGILASTWGGNGRMFFVSGRLNDLQIENNTGFSTLGYLQFGDDTAVPKQRFTFRNNVGGNAQYNIQSPLANGVNMLTTYCGTSYLFAGNVIVTPSTWLMPTGNSYPTTIAGVGMVNPITPLGSGGNWGLAGGSPYYTAGHNGSTPGVNWASFWQLVANVDR